MSVRKHESTGGAGDIEEARQRAPEVAFPRARTVESLTPDALLQLQRTLGNHAAGRVLSQRRMIQRLTPPDALEAAVVRGGVKPDWYNRVLVPGLTTIAAKGGQDFDQYIAPLTEPQFLEQVSAFMDEFKSEPSSLSHTFSGWFSSGPTLIDSTVYPGKKRVKDTNLLIEAQALQNGKPTEQILRFIADYRAGNLEWYRGVSVSHFAWKALQLYGTLASEGTADTPTFTMDNPNPHRWLPGLYQRDGNCDGIAMTIGREAAGLRELTDRTEAPTGAVVKYRIAPGTPVAYLNDGEQVVRGPISGGAVTVAAVLVRGPGNAYREVAQGANPTDLPPPAPYNAAAGSAAMNTWEGQATAWVNAH